MLTPEAADLMGEERDAASRQRRGDLCIAQSAWQIETRRVMVSLNGLPLSPTSPWLWKWRLGMLTDCVPGLANTSVCVLLPVLFASVLIQQSCSPREAATPEMSQQALSVSFWALWLDIPAQLSGAISYPSDMLMLGRYL